VLLQSPLPIYEGFAANDFELSPFHKGFSVCEVRTKVPFFFKVPLSSASFFLNGVRKLNDSAFAVEVVFNPLI
jgi:hypothetical protein